MLVTCSEWHVCSYLSCYAGNLVIMKLVLSQLRMLETCSILIVMYHSDIFAVSFNKCTLCKSLWIKASNALNVNVESRGIY